MTEPRLRIAFVYDALFPYVKGGAERRYHELARRLRDRHDVHMVSWTWWDGQPDASLDGLTLHGAYGPRLLRMRGCVNQIESVLALLKSYRASRRAVIQLFNAEDLTEHLKEIPCTCTLQFLVRGNRFLLLPLTPR